MTAAKEASEASAAAALATAAGLRQRVGIISRMLAVVGLETPAIQTAREAERAAEKARLAARAVRLNYREDLAHADRLGAAQAIEREKQQQEWERRPHVADARREDHGNDLVMAALKSGKPEMRDILKEDDGLRIAREMLLRREAEELAEQQWQQLHDQRTAQAPATLRNGPAVQTAPGFCR